MPFNIDPAIIENQDVRIDHDEEDEHLVVEAKRGSEEQLQLTETLDTGAIAEANLALDMSPTWTDQHTFSEGLTVEGTTTTESLEADSANVDGTTTTEALEADSANVDGTTTTEALEAKIEETSFSPYQVGPHIIDRANPGDYSSIGVVNLSNSDLAHYTIYFQVQPSSNARWEMTLYNDGEVVSDAAAYSIFGLATNSSTIETDSQEEATTIPLSTISDSHNNTPTIAKLDVFPNEGNVDWTFRNPLPSGEPSTGSRSENGRGTANVRQRIDAIEFQNSSGTGVRGSGTNSVILSANGREVNNNESITEGV